ncbi:unnamed protein product [Gemmata massiliana]|uniref:Uncharacterized protein n=1 Tax=Gemmata massiliana TaxID=1210884 RepID=A0A6P2DAN5_9BACT|nr:unnamed protein product [Gemmata massiliana]
MPRERVRGSCGRSSRSGWRGAGTAWPWTRTARPGCDSRTGPWRCPWHGPVLPTRDHGLTTTGLDRAHELLLVTTLVTIHQPRRCSRQQEWGVGNVGLLARTPGEPAWATRARSGGRGSWSRTRPGCAPAPAPLVPGPVGFWGLRPHTGARGSPWAPRSGTPGPGPGVPRTRAATHQPGPPIEPAPHPVPMAEPLGPVAPRDPGSGHERHRIHEPPGLVLRTVARYQTRDPVPIRIRNRMAGKHARPSENCSR